MSARCVEGRRRSGGVVLEVPALRCAICRAVCSGLGELSSVLIYGWALLLARSAGSFSHGLPAPLLLALSRLRLLLALSRRGRKDSRGHAGS